MPREIESAGQQCGLVERRGDDAVDLSPKGEINRPLHRPASESTRFGGGPGRMPVANDLVSVDPTPARPDDQKLRRRPDAIIAQRGRGDLRTYAAGIAERDGEPWERAAHSAARIKARGHLR